MPEGMIALRPDAATAADIQNRATAMQRFINDEASRNCGDFYLLMESVGKDAQLKAVALSAIQSAGGTASGAYELLQQVRQEIEQLARLCGGLESGAYELAAWRRADQPDKIQLGVWRKGSVPRPSSDLDFPLLPIIVVVGVGVVAAGLLAANLWAYARETSAKAELLRAQTGNLMAQAIANAPAADRAGLADAFAKAQQAADPGPESGWLMKFGRGLASLATDFVNAQAAIFSNMGEWLPWVIGGAVLLLSGGGERRRRRRRA